MSTYKEHLGVANGVLAGVSFGLIPLFSIPLLADGMENISIIIFRFLFGCLVMLAVLLCRKVDMRINAGDLLRISLLSLSYITTAIATLESYKYLSSGVATALIYTDPIWCALIGIAFFHEVISKRICSAVLLATVGVMMLTGVFSEEIRFSVPGVSWGLLSGLSYALYLIFVPRMRIKSMPSLKLTFYVFLIAMILLVIYNFIKEGRIETPENNKCWINLFLLGLIPTAVSNICVTSALKLIDSTIVAILGAFEPLTAMVIGILVLGDPFSIFTIGGTILILLAVAILTLLPKKAQS